jgi:hypothetical protein
MPYISGVILKDWGCVNSDADMYPTGISARPQATAPKQVAGLPYLLWE